MKTPAPGLDALTLDVVTAALADHTGNPDLDFATYTRHNCHGAALGLVRTGLLGPHARVARGVHPQVLGQHSWAVAGPDCYDPGALIVDLALWSYIDQEPSLTIGHLGDLDHHPHGQGHIMEWGCPVSGNGEPFGLDFGPTGPSVEASLMLDLFTEVNGTLDRYFWMNLLSTAPVEDWPAAEFIYAAIRVGLEEAIPIDRRGMLTDLNPGNLYR